MGKHNSKLKTDTLEKLTAETYCKRDTWYLADLQFHALFFSHRKRD